MNDSLLLLMLNLHYWELSHVTMSSSRKYLNQPHRKDFFKDPPYPSGNSSSSVGEVLLFSGTVRCKDILQLNSGKEGSYSRFLPYNVGSQSKMIKPQGLSNALCNVSSPMQILIPPPKHDTSVYMFFL